MSLEANWWSFAAPFWYPILTSHGMQQEGGSEVIPQICSGGSEVIPQICSGGSEVVPQICSGGSEVIPQICSWGSEVITQICSGGSEVVPQICSGGSEVIPQICSGGSEVIPQICSGEVKLSSNLLWGKWSYTSEICSVTKTTQCCFYSFTVKGSNRSNPRPSPLPETGSRGDLLANDPPTLGGNSSVCCYADDHSRGGGEGDGISADLAIRAAAVAKPAHCVSSSPEGQYLAWLNHAVWSNQGVNQLGPFALPIPEGMVVGRAEDVVIG